MRIRIIHQCSATKMVLELLLTCQVIFAAPVSLNLHMHIRVSIEQRCAKSPQEKLKPRAPDSLLKHNKKS